MESLLSKNNSNKERLQFKPWLIQQISSAKFKDLEWIDVENKRVFKVPWTKKNYPNWEEHHEIFKAWAKYRSEIRSDPSIANQHISLMKSNFRTILNKTSEIEELKDFHQLGLQTGNYKVYKILTPEEGASKRIRPMMEKMHKVTVEPSSDIIEIQTSGTDVQWLVEPNIPESWVARSSSISMALLEAGQATAKRRSSPEFEEAAPKRKVKKTQATQTAQKNSCFNAKEVVFFSVPNSTNIVEESTQEEVITENPSDCAPVQGFNILLEAAKLSSSLSPDASLVDDDKVLGVEPSIVDALKTLSIAKEQLLMYDIKIKYGDYEVVAGTYRDMQTGYRIHSNILESSESLKNEHCPKSIKLPEPSNVMGRIFDSVFSNMHKGVTVKLDSDYNLIAKRLCSSSIFISATYTELGSLKNYPLPRHGEVVLFAYSKFLLSLFGSITEKNSITCSDLTIFISVGKKMRNEHQKSSIGIQLVPAAALTMLDLVKSY